MKQPNWKVPFALSLTLLILGSFTYWLQFSHKPKKERADSQTKKPIPYSSDTQQISHVRIKSAQGLIELNCDSLEAKTCKPDASGNWSISYPEKLPGDVQSVKDLLSNVNSMLATETIDLSDEPETKRKQLLEEYGLSDARRTSIGTEFIEITLDNGKKLAAWFGEPHPVGDKTFVGATENGVMNDKTIFLIANFYKNNLFGKTLTVYRSKDLFSFNRGDIDSFEAKTSSGKIEGVRASGIWTVNGMAGDYDRIETLLSSIAQAKAKEFPLEAAYKGAKTALSYRLHFKTGDISLEVLEKTEGATKAKGKTPANPGYTHSYLKSDHLKQVVEIESGLKTQLDKKLNELRRNLLLTQTEKVTSTEVKLEGKSFPVAADFHFDGKAWSLKNKDLKLDSSKVAGLMEQLSSAHCPEIVSPAPLQGPDAVILSIGDEKLPARFRYAFYSVGGKSYARDLNSKANEAFSLDAGLKNSFPFAADSWKLK